MAGLSGDGAAIVRVTANFEANLADIAQFGEARGAPVAFDNLLDQLADPVIGNLERHPRMGRRFFARAGHSIEVRSRLASLLDRYGQPEVREYLTGDYLLLYAFHEEHQSVDLLSIRHHRQLSFDLEGFLQSR